jgi:hypothetical protein
MTAINERTSHVFTATCDRHLPAIARLLAATVGAMLFSSIGGSAESLPRMLPVIDPSNLYSEAGPGHLSPAVAGALYRIYVPDLRSNDLYVIDPDKMQVVNHFKVGVQAAARRSGLGPQDVVGHQ